MLSRLILETGRAAEFIEALNRLGNPLVLNWAHTRARYLWRNEQGPIAKKAARSHGRFL